MARLITLAVVVALAAAPRPAAAYSVLTHEANIDAVWDSDIRPLLARRYPRASADDLTKARAFAYGGSVIQDLGYYPFGPRFFSNLVHYTRSGEFVETMIRDAKDVNEYAFALGALAHYAADNTGHPEAVNKAVALMFPKLKAKFGDNIRYVESPASHVIVEFSFDIVQVAAGAYLPEAYHAFIGFEVARSLFERAFHETYGLETKEVFGDEDLTLATYRHSVSELIPELTRVAWRDKKEEIERLHPGAKADAFVYRYTRKQYEQEFGTGYKRPGFFARIIGWIYRVMPKIGPLRPLSFKTPTPEAEALFAASFRDTKERYRAALAAAGRGRLDLPNTDFDTGKPSAHGEYALADETYGELLDRLNKKRFEGVPPALAENIRAFYAAAPNKTASKKEWKRAAKIREQLAALNSTRPR